MHWNEQQKTIKIKYSLGWICSHALSAIKYQAQKPSFTVVAQLFLGGLVVWGFLMSGIFRGTEASLFVVYSLLNCPLCWVLVRQHLEFLVLFWAPHHRKNIEVRINIQVQRRGRELGKVWSTNPVRGSLRDFFYQRECKNQNGKHFA